MTDTTDRRGFLTRLGGLALGGAALALLPPGCDTAPEGCETDDFGMHGPIAEATDALQLPRAESAEALFGDYADGRPFSRRWAVGHVARGERDQVVVVMVDLDTGGHARMEIFRHDPAVRPIAASRDYGVFMDNGAHGDAPTPYHMRQLAERLAEILAEHEGYAAPDWRVPTLREAALLQGPPPGEARVGGWQLAPLPTVAGE